MWPFTRSIHAPDQTIVEMGGKYCFVIDIQNRSRTAECPCSPFVSMGSAKIWVLVGPHKMQWNVLVHPTVDDVALVASLAFIHNQWFL
jgi:hypothetical protein